MNNGYVISGSLFGDEGKGTFVDFLAHEKDIKQNVRYNGGSQASHTVIHDGYVHKFSQLGSSMFVQNNKTYLSGNTIVNPFNLYEEAKRYSEISKLPISYILDRIYIDKNALVVTPYHKLIGMIRELYLKDNKRGSVGTGVSQTRDLQDTKGIGIKASDLLDLDGMGTRNLNELFEYTKEYYKNHVVSIDPSLLACNIDEDDIYYLTDDSNRDYIKNCYDNLMNTNYFNIVDGIKEFYTPGEDMLFEGSQGLLIDRYYGIRPHTTKLDTTNHFARKLCEEINYNPVLIGASRAFASRHGKGLLPTKDDELQKVIFDPNQTPSFWQGSPIYGWYDALLMRYSQSINNNDELFLSGLDQLSPFKAIKVCNCYLYKGEVDEEFERTFEYCKDGGRIFITNIIHSSIYLNKYLERCTPIYIDVKGWECNIRNINKYEDLPKECHDFVELIESLVNTPISLVGVGPSRENKIRRLVR